MKVLFKGLFFSALLFPVAYSSEGVLGRDESAVDENGKRRVLYVKGDEDLKESAKKNGTEIKEIFRREGLLSYLEAAGWDPKKIERGDIQRRIGDIIFKYMMTTKYEGSYEEELDKGARRHSSTGEGHPGAITKVSLV